MGNYVSQQNRLDQVELAYSSGNNNVERRRVEAARFLAGVINQAGAMAAQLNTDSADLSPN